MIKLKKTSLKNEIKEMRANLIKDSTMYSLKSKDPSPMRNTKISEKLGQSSSNFYSTSSDNLHNKQ